MTRGPMVPRLPRLARCRRRGLASASSASSAHPHLIVLLHGLHGEASDMAYLQHRILAQHHTGVRVLASSAAGDQVDGIDASGLRVAHEVEAACNALGPHGSLSIVAHSNGGLVSRWALGRLEDGGVLDRWKPRFFVTLASPHLGVYPFGRLGRRRSQAASPS